MIQHPLELKKHLKEVEFFQKKKKTLENLILKQSELLRLK